MEQDGVARRGSWAPALLAGQVVLLVLLWLTTGVAALAGVRLDATPGDPDTTRYLLLAGALVVVAGTTARLGRRPAGPDARWWAVVAGWLLVPWTWTGLWLGGSSPAAVAPGTLLLAAYLWPFLLLATVLGGIVASLLGWWGSRRR